MSQKSLISPLAQGKGYEVMSRIGGYTVGFRLKGFRNEIFDIWK